MLTGLADWGPGAPVPPFTVPLVNKQTLHFYSLLWFNMKAISRRNRQKVKQLSVYSTMQHNYTYTCHNAMNHL